MRHAGDVVTKTEILENVWDAHFDGDANIVEVYVGYLRTQDRPAVRTRQRSRPSAAPATGSRRDGRVLTGSRRPAARTWTSGAAERTDTDPDRPAVPARQLADDGQAQPAAALVPGARVVEADEPVEDAVPVRLRDPPAVVADRQYRDRTDALVDVAHLDRHPRVAWCTPLSTTLRSICASSWRSPRTWSGTVAVDRQVGRGPDPATSS